MRHNVVAYLALFVALGGTSYAAIRLPANSVGAKQIKKNAVRSSDVKNTSLLAADFKAGQLPAGPRGAQGPAGPPGISGLQRVIATHPTNSASPKGVRATCPAGKRVIGSGAYHEGGTTGITPSGLTDISIGEIQASSETTVPGFVNVTALEEEPTAADWSVTAIALCANVS